MVALLSAVAALALLVWRMKTGGPATTAEEQDKEGEAEASADEAKDGDPLEESTDAENSDLPEESAETEEPPEDGN